MKKRDLQQAYEPALDEADAKKRLNEIKNLGMQFIPLAPTYCGLGPCK